MAEEGLKELPFAERRQAARERAGDIQDKHRSIGDGQGWFEELYQKAGDDEAQVPWADMEPHPLLAHWIGKSGELHEGSLIDIGCGLGDNAENLSSAGYDVTAFDLSETAINWAKKRFPESDVEYRAADLFNLPKEWQGAFSFVHETYTLQALTGDLRKQAFKCVADLVASGGRLLVICRSRPDDAELVGPPWPLSKTELDQFLAFGLRQVSVEQIDVTEDRVIPHFRAMYARDEI